jgi:hypothetical protein
MWQIFKFQEIYRDIFDKVEDLHTSHTYLHTTTWISHFSRPKPKQVKSKEWRRHTTVPVATSRYTFSNIVLKLSGLFLSIFFISRTSNQSEFDSKICWTSGETIFISSIGCCLRLSMTIVSKLVKAHRAGASLVSAASQRVRPRSAVLSSAVDKIGSGSVRMCNVGESHPFRFQFQTLHSLTSMPIGIHVESSSPYNLRSNELLHITCNFDDLDDDGG